MYTATATVQLVEPSISVYPRARIDMHKDSPKYFALMKQRQLAMNVLRSLMGRYDALQQLAGERQLTHRQRAARDTVTARQLADVGRIAIHEFAAPVQ